MALPWVTNAKPKPTFCDVGLLADGSFCVGYNILSAERKVIAKFRTDWAALEFARFTNALDNIQADFERSVSGECLYTVSTLSCIGSSFAGLTLNSSLVTEHVFYSIAGNKMVSVRQGRVNYINMFEVVRVWLQLDKAATFIKLNWSRLMWGTQGKRKIAK